LVLTVICVQRLYKDAYERALQHGVIHADLLWGGRPSLASPRTGERGTRAATGDDAAVRVPTSFVGVALMLQLCKQVWGAASPSRV
jgi:hypothetical protein